MTVRDARQGAMFLLRRGSLGLTLPSKALAAGFQAAGTITSSSPFSFMNVVSVGRSRLAGPPVT